MTDYSLTNFLCLIVLDGWGIAPSGSGNAIEQANTPNIKRLWTNYPHTQLVASGEAVGLPKGEVGNTETGHLNIGAGRIIYQDLVRINKSIADGSFFFNKVLIEAIKHAKKNKSNLHIMGLVSRAGVHSNIDHLYALLQLCKQQHFSNVFLHLFTDGRDSPQKAAAIFIAEIQSYLENASFGKIASIMGRYWAMDRDMKWERTAKAYGALTQGIGSFVKTPQEAFERSYGKGITDEFIEPSILTNDKGKPIGIIQDNDSVIFFNFRIDRPRQLSRSLVISDFENKSIAWEFDPFLIKYEKTNIIPASTSKKPAFKRDKILNNLYFVTMTQYEKILIDYGAHVAFPPQEVEMPLGQIISEKSLRQLRITESEKEQFVGFFFDGGRKAFNGEDIIIIPSPKVATYDLKPEMMAREITAEVLKRLKDKKKYSFVLINFANPDMVAHTGNISATVAACGVVDECIGQIANFVLGFNGSLIVTADHGNAEEMLNLKTSEADTEHNLNLVPFIAVANEFVGKSIFLEEGILADIAPTALALMKIDKPSQMSGRNLLENIIKNS